MRRLSKLICTLFIYSAITLLVATGCASIAESRINQNIAAEYFQLAEGYAGLSKYEQAAHYYRRSAEWPAFQAAGWYGEGRMLVLSGKWPEAVSVFSRLSEVDSENGLVRSALAYALAGDGQTGAALELYRSEYQKNSDDPVTLRNYAGILVMAGENEQALEIIERLRIEFPDHEAAKGLEVLEKKTAPQTVEAPAETLPAENPAAQGLPAESLPAEDPSAATE